MKGLSFRAPPQLAVAENATSPNPGSPGVEVWSTTASKTLTWNGSLWSAPVAGGTPPNTSGADLALARGFALP